MENQRVHTDLKDIDLGRLVVALRKYNDQFNGGSIMAAIVLSRVDEAGETKELDFEVRRQIAWGEIERDFGKMLKTTGLSLEPVAGAMTLFTGEAQIPASEMRLNIVDAKTFIQYLSALSLPLTSGQIHGLSEVAKNLICQLAGEYKLEDLADERILNLFSCLSQMIVLYRELGLGDSVKSLAKYLEISRAGYLREYLAVERVGLFAEIDGQNFGPSTWQRDETPEGYRARWNRAINVLNLVSQNPQADRLAQKLRTHLRESAEYARKDLERITYFSEDRKGAFRAVIEEFLQVLAL